MVCGGFTCSKNALFSLNVVYLLVGALLIGVAAWGTGYGSISSIHIIGGVIAVGVFVLLISLIGLFGASRHHQVLLFFYMIILFIVFLFQFGVSCSCLAITEEQQGKLLERSWQFMTPEMRQDLEVNMDCCGLLNTTDPGSSFNQDVEQCRAACKQKQECSTCGDLMLHHAGKVLKVLGGVGLFFSFTQIFGVWLAMRYRNQKDPRANPSAFL
ncbi:tetraspanin-31-like [Engraulis encrasicolus]|uniref:tetraspanin-31-like n=1 Tax=Engraulis encrasicolus TaxID=184585 RepID=UPI002FD595D0